MKEMGLRIRDFIDVDIGVSIAKISHDRYVRPHNKLGNIACTQRLRTMKLSGRDKSLALPDRY